MTQRGACLCMILRLSFCSHVLRGPATDAALRAFLAAGEVLVFATTFAAEELHPSPVVGALLLIVVGSSECLFAVEAVLFLLLQVAQIITHCTKLFTFLFEGSNLAV